MLRPTAEVVAERLAVQDTAAVEQALLGTEDPAEIAALFEAFCLRHLGAPVVGALGYASSAGVLLALELADGRRVAVKLHGPGNGPQYPAEYLAALRVVQGALADGGFPAPRPLLGPLPLARGLATVDTSRPGGPADGHDPAVRGALAVTLARLVGGAAPFRDLPGLRADARHGKPLPEGLWGTPHTPLFDFKATHDGAVWIDELARPAWTSLARPAGRSVIGHIDWSVKNLGWDGSTVVAVYDWDSLVVAPEPVVVGEAARGFTATWELPVEPAPSPAEAAAFVRAYEAARGTPFSTSERHTAEAAALYAAAYSARCEHAARPDLTEFPAGSFRDRLRRHGADWFRFG